MRIIQKPDANLLIAGGMNIYFTRDSVCAGDDWNAPHATRFTVPHAITINELMRTVCQAHLPKIQGGKATWSIASGIPVAVLAQQWEEPKLLPHFELGMAILEIISETIRLHANYHAQLEPEVVFEVLERLTLRAIPNND